jgi:hypothetical protein
LKKKKIIAAKNQKNNFSFWRRNMNYYMTTYLIYYIDQIYFQNWMCVWLYFKNLLWFLFSFLCFLSFFFFLEKTFFCKKLNNLFAPPNKMYVVFLN